MLKVKKGNYYIVQHDPLTETSGSEGRRLERADGGRGGGHGRRCGHGGATAVLAAAIFLKNLAYRQVFKTHARLGLSHRPL